ncbi:MULTISPECIES: fatty acyl-AMP ligase [Streptomyces]|uniref:Fatty acyl-AMP ligase n=1 Tax=Streptomyces doudnae TaxID=3075536 RepID=A0ABD5EZB1_9ACTN|nr:MULTISPECIES: fatty acyl-AMP ligase [unclassified Streptomyces]MDT0439512.1 fatty acyl-AMP ligase [Streptomyces sp. DSM 41981]MYQ69255.1 AMP-binding protein [Streptomyces sp. SID4950]SCE52517.1 fatty-acyl-CoA synthase [Streptomyces sp. SolWspMP-5a-2]
MFAKEVLPPDTASASTFVHVLAENLGHPEGGCTFIQEDGREHFLSWSELSREAMRRGRLLLRSGLRKGQRIALVVPEQQEFVLTFLGAVSVGVIPVPLYPPMDLGRIEAYREDAAAILRAAGAHALLMPRSLADLLAPLLRAVEGSRAVVLEEFFAEPLGEGTPQPEAILPDDVMFLQFTSGSTGAPKGVRVTHAGVLANCAAVISALRLERGRDRGVSWLPLYHDMGLIGFVLAPLVARCPVSFLPTLRFALSPRVWLETVSRERATVTFAPNFGLALAVKDTPARELRRLDLSCLRVVGCGAEPNHPQTLRSFAAHFAAAGLRPGTMVPCYGMAEATLAISFGEIGVPLALDAVQKEPYHASGLARPASKAELPEAQVEFVPCGRSIAGHRILIVDDDGNPLPERHIGEVVFQGPSVAAGYHGDAEATRRSFTPDGLRTGDCGYLAADILYVTSRKKDLLIVNGRNHDPQTVEWAAAEVDGLRKGNVVAFTRPGRATEEVVIVAELRRGDAATVARQVRGHIQTKLSLSVADVLLLPPGELPKTSSGKVKRSTTRQQYLEGTLRGGARSGRAAHRPSVHPR